jgi:Cof subfamily protein (haloacid dehalogenase superfamily)
MGKFDGVLLCSDIDATLLLKEDFPEENVKAIKYFQENGGRFTLATGRLFDFLDKYSHLVVPNAPFISMNGTLIVDKTTGETLYKCALSADPGKMVEETMRAIPYLRCAYVFPMGRSFIITRTEDDVFETAYPPENVHILPGAPPLSDERSIKYAKNADELNKIFGYPEKEIFKIVFSAQLGYGDRVKEEILERFSEFSVFRSWANGVEVQSPLADKGKGARRLAEILGDVKLLVCAGDYENDISMIKEADIGYAVANAHPSVKAVADRITERECLEGAIAEIIYDLDRELT